MKYLLRKAKRVPRKTGFMPRVHHPPYGSSGGARRARRTHFSEQIREASISSLGFAPRLAGLAI